MMLLRLLIVLSVISFCSNVFATDYYVRPHVTDGDCSYPAAGGCDGLTYATAWEGIVGGDGTPVNWTTVDGGDGKLFVAGTHNERINIGANGESGAPMQIVSCIVSNGASTNDAGIIDLEDTGSATYCIGGSVSYVTIDGMTLTRGDQAGIRINTSTNGTWEIKNCVIYDNGVTDEANGADGILITDGANHSIHDNYIYQNHNHGIYIYPSTNNVSSTSIYQNVIYDNHHTNIDIQGYHGAADKTTTNISIYRNLIYDTGGSYSLATGATSIYLAGPTDASSKVDTVNIYYNVIHDAWGIGVHVKFYTYNVNIYNNTFYNGAVTGHTPSCISLEHSDTATINIKNNICSTYTGYGVQDAGANDPTVNDNILYNNSLGSSTGFTLDTAGDDANLTTDPLFNSTTYFLPKYSSPAIDAGADVSLTTDYTGGKVPRGAGVDIGAYEYCPNAIRDSLKKILGGLGLNF